MDSEDTRGVVVVDFECVVWRRRGDERRSGDLLALRAGLERPEMGLVYGLGRRI